MHRPLDEVVVTLVAGCVRRGGARECEERQIVTDIRTGSVAVVVVTERREEAVDRGAGSVRTRVGADEVGVVGADVGVVRPAVVEVVAGRGDPVRLRVDHLVVFDKLTGVAIA